MTASAQASPSPAADGRQEFRYVARQPIFTREQKVFGYELLFRNGVDNFFHASDPEAAARSTLDSSLLVGIDVLCDGQRAFINCTRDLLLKDCITLLPSGQTVVEVLENVEPDDLVRAACERLKVAGYTLALDDFITNDPRQPLVPMADILKVDFARTNPIERSALVKQFGGGRCRMLAEKVETQEDFLGAKAMGFVYFQGFYLRHPEVMKAKEIPANRLNYLRLLEMVSHNDLDLRELEHCIKSEASVLYRLLRYLNSPVFGFGTTIRSVRHALAILGEREVRRWVRLVALVSAGVQKSSDVVLSALVRARFCELLSPRIGQADTDLFLLGLLSMMDLILEVPMSQVLEHVPIDLETKAVLLGGTGRLRPVYQLMVAREAGEWEQARDCAAHLRVSEADVAEMWWQAMQWARQVASGA